MSRNKLKSLEEFIFTLQTIRFSFETEELHDFVEQNIIEADIHRIAYAGGDAYMMAYMNAVKKKLKYKLEKTARNASIRTDKERAALKIFEKLDPELQQYILDLSHQDWHYDYSEDPKVYSSAHASYLRLQDIAKTKGGKYLEMWRLYDPFVKS